MSEVLEEDFVTEVLERVRQDIEKRSCRSPNPHAFTLALKKAFKQKFGRDLWMPDEISIFVLYPGKIGWVVEQKKLNSVEAKRWGPGIVRYLQRFF